MGAALLIILGIMLYIFLGTVTYRIFYNFDHDVDMVKEPMITLFPLVWILGFMYLLAIGPYKLAMFVADPKNWKFKIKLEKNG